MKFKKSLIVLSVIEIVLCILCFFNVNTILENMLTSAESFKQISLDFYNNYVSIIKNTGKLNIILNSSISIILNLIIIYRLYKNTIPLKKTSSIVILFIILALSNDFISMVLPIISIIFVSRLTKEEIKEKMQDDKKIFLPKIIYTKKEKLLGILLFIYYIFMMIILPEIVTKVNIFIKLFIYLSLIIFSILIFRKELTKGFKAFFKNIKDYIKLFFKLYGKFLIVYLIIAIVVALLKGTEMANQVELKSVPMYLLMPLALIYAPLVEESVFRGSIRRLIDNKWLYIIISGILFGMIHVLSENSVIDMLLSLIPYSLLGSFLAYLYTKSNNIVLNMYGHFFINLIACIAMILSMYA